MLGKRIRTRIIESGMVTRSQLRSDSSKLPPGWKKIHAWVPGAQEIRRELFISPEGKKFLSKKEMKAYILEKGDNVDVVSPTKKERSEYKMVNSRLVFSEKILSRRRHNKMKSIMPQLMKFALKNNHSQKKKEDKRRKYFQSIFKSRKITLNKAFSSISSKISPKQKLRREA